LRLLPYLVKFELSVAALCLLLPEDGACWWFKNWQV
jgi:hypothetical protein